VFRFDSSDFGGQWDTNISEISEARILGQSVLVEVSVFILKSMFWRAAQNKTTQTCALACALRARARASVDF